MSDSSIILLILSIPFIFGFLLYLLHISSNYDINVFWGSKFRFFVLIFFPLIAVVGAAGYGGGSLPGFYSSFNTRRTIETIFCTIIGLSVGFYMVSGMYPVS
jgi:hypothetical protein